MKIQTPHIYDICIIGSGAAGGFAAQELARAGADTILLEAGDQGRLENLHIHDWPYELPKRGFGFAKQASLYPDGIQGELQFARERVGIDRIRTLGGRTFHWNAACLRFAADDFREHSLHGFEQDWPIQYDELAPFYDYVEREMHVFGNRDGLEVLPGGNFVAPPPPLRCVEQYAQQRLAKYGIPLVAARKAVLRTGRKGRGACHYCGHCMDVCDVRAVWSSDVTVIPAALATGKLTLRRNALAREILVNNDGLASGVSYVDRVTGKEQTLRARIIVLGCATIESARLLLNSKSEKFPNGLANNSDNIGRYLGGHVALGMMGYLKDFVGKQYWQGDGMTDHAYIPRFDKASERRDFVGGFGIQLNYHNQAWPHHAKALPGFGANYKTRVRDYQLAAMQFGGFGKGEQRYDNRVRVNAAKPDKWGIPTPVIDFAWSANDRAMFAAMRQQMLQLYDQIGAEFVNDTQSNINGFASHEAGTCRMGNDPKTSVLNQHNQAHEVKNLFIVDGSSFTTMPEKNPTLTIAALAVRAARYIAEQKKQRNL